MYDKSVPVINNDLYMTKNFYDNSAILVVDLEEQYIKTRTDYDFFKEEYVDEAMKMASVRMLNVCKNILSLPNNIPIFLTNQTKPCDLIKDSFKRLPNWHCFNKNTKKAKSEQDIFLSQLSGYKTILICGLWKGRCVMDVHDYLREHGINAVILDNPNFTLEEQLIGDPMPINQLRKCIEI